MRRILSVLLLTLSQQLLHTWVGEDVLAQTLTISGPFTISKDTLFTSVTVDSGGVLTADGLISVTGDMIIKSGGVVTHSGYPINNGQGLRLNVAGILEVRNNGAIDVTGKGLRGGKNSNNGSVHGETYNAVGIVYPGVTGNVAIAGAFVAGAGASYGGQGGYGGRDGIPVSSNDVYGMLEDPVQFGSGGGGIFSEAGPLITPGGNGGGLIRIVARTCIVGGKILANGTDASSGYGTPGGGSGGGIRLDVETLIGSGTIEAEGGVGRNIFSGGQGGGSGSGGRIAIYYSNMTLPADSVKASGGASARGAAAGTVYMKASNEPYGSLTIDNRNVASNWFTPIRSGLNTFQHVRFLNRGQILIEASNAFTVEEPIALINTTILRITGTLTLNNASGFDLNVQSGSTLILDTLSTVNANAIRINASTLTSYRNFSFPVATDLELSGSGVINILNSAELSLRAFTPTNIQSGTVYIPVGSQLDITSLSATLGAGVILIKDGTFGASDALNSLTIDSGGVVTHSGYPSNNGQGLRLNVTGILEIRNDGAIDVTGKGLRGGKNSNNGSVHGETYDALGIVYPGVTGNVAIARAFVAGAGASYGGQGGYGGRDDIPVPSNAVYGLLEDPIQFGSGGGGIFSEAGPVITPGGNGGGLIRIAAKTCIVDGKILANGTDASSGYGTPGGGSGGGIRLDVETLTGSGTIEAKGGLGRNIFSGGQGGGSGSGGRIAIYYSNMTLPADSIKASGGFSTRSGAAGTVFLSGEQRALGQLIVNNAGNASVRFTPLRTMLATFKKVAVLRKARLLIENSLSLPDSSEIEVDLYSGAALDNGAHPLTVFGTVSLAGSLGLKLLDGYVPANLDTLVVIECDSLRGSFNSLPDYPDTLHMRYTDRGLIAFVGDRRSYADDVGSVGMASPKDAVFLNSIVTPHVLVQNYGSVTKTTPVTLSIGQSYLDTSSVTVNPFAKDMTSFVVWKASPLGTHSVMSKTLLSTDKDTTNDAFLGAIAVIVSPNTPVITDIIPRTASNASFTNLIITGKNFQPHLSIKLTKEGQQDIFADSLTIQFFDSTRISATFDLTNAVIGNWNIVLINPDGSQAIFYEGLTIEAEGTREYNNLYIDIIGRKQIRIDRGATLWIEYGNTANINLFDAMILIKLPLGFTYKLNIPALAGVDSITVNYPEGGVLGSYIIVPVWLYSIPANYTARISVKIQPPITMPPHTLFDIEAILLENKSRVFAQSGSFEYFSGSSIHSIISSAYEILISKYPDLSTYGAGVFADTLRTVLFSQSANRGPTSLARLAYATISNIVGKSLPESLIVEISNTVISSINDYYGIGDTANNTLIYENMIFACPDYGCPKPKPCGQKCAPSGSIFPGQLCVTSDFCKTRKSLSCPHGGTDYRMKEGTEIYSPIDGTWVYTANDNWQCKQNATNQRGWGFYVWIKDDCGNCWVFAHLNQKPIRPIGGRYYAGKTVIGYSGQSCVPNAEGTGPHLHVELLCDCVQTQKNDPNEQFGAKECCKGSECDPPPPEGPSAESKGSFEGVTSEDPNEKSGTQGTGLKQYVSGKKQLPYIIFFENIATAKAPAQIVVVSDTLNTKNVLLESFSLGPINFSSHTIVPPSSSKSYSAKVDLRPADSLIVKIDASLDTTTGVATWRFESIDPITGSPPEFDGFLSPNINPPEGEGSISFNVQLKDSLGFGTEIRNKATIVFDLNAPIQTQEWLNTIDNSKPISRVLPFAMSQDSTSFLVRWSGSDVGAGVKDYSVYVSEDSGAFQPWLISTTEMSGTYPGALGKTYGFYSIARDSVGNLEAPKDSADAVVTIITGVKERQEEIPKQYSLSQSYPNPFNPTTVIEYALPVAGKVTLKIYDILGREVKTLVDEVQQTGYKTVEWDSKNNAGIRVATGTYFYRLEATKIGSQEKAFVQVRKMLLLK